MLQNDELVKYAILSLKFSFIVANAIHHFTCSSLIESEGGVGGAEIDIFETYFTDDIFYRNYIFSTIHCNGFDDDSENIDSQKLVHYHVPNLLKKYTTFGLLWTEDEYIFYVDGVETVRSSFAKGTSKDEQEVILSITINKNVTLSKDVISKYFVDYVKIYQKI